MEDIDKIIEEILTYWKLNSWSMDGDKKVRELLDKLILLSRREIK